jgi:protocatechuate 3,4-dioxygenase beta subunit
MAISRREFSRRLLMGVAAGSASLSSACGSSGDAAGSGGRGGASGAGGASACVVYPRQTEGPFYLDLDSVRSDITGGKPGAALRLRVQAQATDCAPLKDLAVDVWHCDAAGVYSGFAGQLGGLDTTGETFLRGTQITDASGVAEFETIYPGWYPGRTTHVHFKVHTSSTMEATSQIYFPEDVTSAVYGTAPYDARGPKDTANVGDFIATNNPTPLAMLDGDAASGYTATIVVTVA